LYESRKRYTLSVPYSSKREGAFLQTLFGLKGGIALDAGCGYGFFTDLLNQIGYEACGLDLDFSRIAEAAKSYQTNFVLADSRSPPFKEDSFDLVFCRGLSTFLTDLQLQTPHEQMDALRRVLKPTGLLIFQGASDLSGRYTTIQNHKIDEVRRFFAEGISEPTIYFLFAPAIVFRVLRGWAFSSVATRLCSWLTKVTGRSGYIVCCGRKSV
jgi:SAM-dependent methyltransferase